MAKSQSFSVPFLSLKDSEICITAISTLQLHCCAGHQGTGIFITPGSTGKREADVTALLFPTPLEL